MWLCSIVLWLSRKHVLIVVVIALAWFLWQCLKLPMFYICFNPYKVTYETCTIMNDNVHHLTPPCSQPAKVLVKFILGWPLTLHARLLIKNGCSVEGKYKSDSSSRTDLTLRELLHTSSHQSRTAHIPHNMIYMYEGNNLGVHVMNICKCQREPILKCKIFSASC
jgi:hypothetical protein